MANKKKKHSMKQAKKKKNTNLLLVAVTAVIVCVAVIFCVNGRKEESAAVVESGEALVINTADVTTDASFYPVLVDGTRMEIIAVRDSQGEIRTAFNTCQVCYGSGRGYYVQSGNYLVCQNCGNRFSMDQVEREYGGCNPWPIFEESKTVTDDTISISYDFLAESKEIFANWKTDY